jgi:hypothetical protein
MPLVKKTYHCKVVRLTNTKQAALQQEHDNLQHYLQTREDRGLYSANRQQADRFYKVIKRTTKYPLSIRNDLIRLEHDPSSIAEYWVRVPVKLVKGGLWIRLIKLFELIPSCECKLYKRDKMISRCCSTTRHSCKDRISECNCNRHGLRYKWTALN